jgi:hypothetical protein
MPRICGPSQKGGWTQPHDRNVEFLYTYTASPMFGGDYWEKSIKEPLLFRCNDQQTERSNQQVLDIGLLRHDNCDPPNIW